MDASTPKEIWTEKVVVEQLRAALADLPGSSMWWGQGNDNRFGPDGWALTGFRRFQYGDFRLETPRLVAVVEIDTAGGVTNLAKYWPYLASGTSVLGGRRFVLAHLFALGSENDYVSHLRLWDYLADRMAADLDSRGVDCHLRRFVSRSVSLAVAEVADFIRAADL